MTWFLDLRAQAVGGGVARDVAIYEDNTPRTVADLQSFVRNQAVVIATHGFNVNRASGRNSLSCWGQYLTLNAATVYLAVLWPGDSAWIPAIDYPIEGNEAIASGNLLATFILKNLTAAGPLSFASHSLGARVVLQTIRGIASTRRVQLLFLMAGAIDNTCLTQEYADAARAVDKISVLASFHDEVLALAFPPGNFFAGLFTRGSPYIHAALGHEGPDSSAGTPVQVGWQISNIWDYGHHNYLATMPPPAPLPSIPLPQTIPALTAGEPDWARFNEWRAAWSAAMFSTRFAAVQ